MARSMLHVKALLIQEQPINEIVEPSSRIKKIHHAASVIENISNGITLRKKERVNYISMIESKNVKETLNDEYWVNSMQEELAQFERNQVWNIVPRPEN